MSSPPLKFILPDHIDSTMLVAYKSCPRKFSLEFGYGLRSSGISPDLHAGACFATALEHIYHFIYTQGLTVPQAMDKTLPIYSKAWGDFEPPPKSAKTFMRMWDAVEDYMKTYPPEDDHVKPFRNHDGTPTFEFSFALPLDPAEGWPLHPVTHEPFIYCGRFDMLGEYLDLPVVKDDKTAGRLESTWSEKWGLRNQFLGYVWSMQRLGYNIDTVVVRGVVILKTEIKQVEAIKQYSNDLISRWEHQTKRTLHAIVANFNEGYFDYDFGDTCTSYGLCNFFASCESANPEAWLADMTVTRWNPLHKNPIEEVAA